MRRICVAIFMLGCAHPAPCAHPRTSAACEDGTECSLQSDCMSGACIGGTCVASCRTEPCSGDSVCIQPSTGAAPIECVTVCPASFHYVGMHPGLACSGGVVTTCARLAAPDTFCDACGCADGSHCFGAGDTPCDGTNCRCGPPAALHAPCHAPTDCASGNCDAVIGCQLADGAACTPGAGDCAYCDPVGAGGYACRAECASDVDCGGARCRERNGRAPACYVDCSGDARVCDAAERCWASGNDRLCVPQ